MIMNDKFIILMLEKWLMLYPVLFMMFINRCIDS